MSKKNFEQAMKELEKIVEELESGELPLEKALKKFEEGMALSGFCSKMLDETDARITILVSSPDGTLEKQAFTDEALDTNSD
jgi:exodeoxyribonuclease VII small subunit